MSELIELGLLGAAPVTHEIPGYPIARMLGHAREGVVALEDAKKVAFDFVFTRTTRSSLATLRRQYDWSALNDVTLDHAALLIRTDRGIMTAFDAGPRAMFTLNYCDARYREFAGEELVDGLAAIVANQPPVPIPPRDA